jgi:ABC-2 type transport system ATP-binding protein
VIEVEHLAKVYRVHKRAPGLVAAARSLFVRSYENVSAVTDVSFSIKSGERVGFLGPNGAGKTTTLKCLSGLLFPSVGSVRVDGFVPFERQGAFLERIMLVLGQKQQLIWDLPPADTFELNRVVYDVPRVEFLRRKERLTEVLGLAPLIYKPTRQLSLGERMKCELAAALLHGPRYLFLDEPTIGLDVAMQATIRAFLREHADETGATLLLTSHYMADVQALCDRVIVIDKGRLSFDGRLSDLAREVRPLKRVVLTLVEGADTSPLTRFGPAKPAGSELTLDVAPDAVRDVVTYALGLACVSDLRVIDPPLEEVVGALFARGAVG